MVDDEVGKDADREATDQACTDVEVTERWQGVDIRNLNIENSFYFDCTDPSYDKKTKEIQNCPDEKSTLGIFEPTHFKICILQRTTISPSLFVYNVMGYNTNKCEQFAREKYKLVENDKSICPIQ